MLIEDGRVLARGPSVSAADAQTESLHGRTLLPKFVDAHCHILPTGLDLQKLNLGSCGTHEAVLDAVRDRHATHPDGWLLAVHYDQTRYDGGRHLTRADLDAISAERPILLRHVSGHSGIANSAALAVAGVGAETLDPAGGSYRRDPSGAPDGVLLENALERVSAVVPNPSLEEMVEAILEAGAEMSDVGIGCACDMMTGRYDLELEIAAYRLAAERGMPIHTRLYVQWSRVFGPRGIGPEKLRELAVPPSGSSKSVGIGGIKIFSDGAIGSGTAAIYGSYGPEAGDRLRSSGQLIYSPEKLTEMVLRADEAGFQVATHAIGDYAADLVMDAYEATGSPSMHRIEHAMILSDAQIERLANLDCIVTFQPEFLMRFGHSYRRQLGDERASRLKRTRSLLDAGIRLAFSSDRPIVSGDPMDGVRMASDRPDGFDPAENCTRFEALLAYTKSAALASGVRETMGSLEPGMPSEFHVLGSPIPEVIRG